MRYAGWTSPSSPPPRPTTTAVRCSARSAFRSVAKDRDGQEGTCQQATGRTEVQGARLHPLSPLWPTAVGVSRLRSVSDLSASDGPRRGDPRHDEVVVVRRMQP